MNIKKEEELLLDLDFFKLKNNITSEAIPVVVQHVETKEVLILAYINEIALKESLQLRQAVFWSTSRNELWHKGSTSGDILELLEVRVNCEQNSLLFLVRPVGVGVCHTRNKDGVSRSSCYYRQLSLNSSGELTFIEA